MRAILTSVLAVQRPVAEDRGMMPLAFVIHFASLLLFGPLVTMMVVTAGTAAYMLGDPQWTRPPERSLMNAATTIAALHVAGVVHVVLGGTHGHFVWPWQGVPIASAAATYALAHTALAEIVVPLITGQPINRSWAGTVLRDCPHHVIGAGLAVGLLEIIDHGLWEVLPVAALPLFFAHRAYCAHVSQIEYEHRSQEAIESLDEGIAVIDGRGLITLWNHALEHMVDCTRAQALGRPLIEALPVLKASGLQRTIDDAIEHESPRSQLLYGVLSSSGARILQVTIRPGDGSVTLLWHDVTERSARSTQSSAAKSGWRSRPKAPTTDCGSGTCARRSSTSPARWRAMIGLPATRRSAGPRTGSTASTPTRSARLKEALNAHLSGKTDHFQHEHRIRHEDGTYRLFLCRGVAVRGTGRRADAHRRLADRHDRACARTGAGAAAPGSSIR